MIFKKRIFSDLFLSLLSSIIPVFILQFLIHPFLASKLDVSTYGNLITIIALISLSAATLGNVLNNSRLIFNSKYSQLHLIGDYNFILLAFLIVNIVFITIGYYFYSVNFSFVGFVLLLLGSLLFLIKSYASVEFRLKLNFKNILFESLYLTIGYAFGYFLFIITDYWEFIYFAGYSFSFLFVLKKTKILRERLIKTRLFPNVSYQTGFLLFSGLLMSAGSYLDKLLIYPLLGAESVTIYFIASILGKTMALGIQPMSGVLLSYLAPLDSFSKSYFLKLVVISFILGIISYIVVLVSSKTILSYLYPAYYAKSMDFVPVVTLSIILLIIANILNAVLLKFKNLKWQIFINSFYLLTYIFCSLYLLKHYDLMGFIIGILIASGIKLLIVIAIFFLSTSNFDRKKGLNLG